MVIDRLRMTEMAYQRQYGFVVARCCLTVLIVGLFIGTSYLAVAQDVPNAASPGGTAKVNRANANVNGMTQRRSIQDITVIDSPC